MNTYRILLVEDEKVVAADIEECVKGLGYEVVGSAASGAEALRLVANTEPDLVLMDIKLKGGLDGIDVAAAIYEEFQIPVVYLTAYADVETLERAKKTCPSGYVLKPFDDRTLRTAIEIALDRHRREMQLIESGRRLATAISSIDEAVIVTQESGHVAVMNQLAESLTGWSQDEAMGKPLSEVFTVLNGQTGSLQRSPAARALREGMSIGLGEHAVLLSRGGQRSIIQGSVTPVRDRQTDTVGACVIFRAANQRSSGENWGTPDHSHTSRLEMMGRLSAGVAQQLFSLLDGSGKMGRTRAASLANRLLAFGQRQPEPPSNFDLNQLIAGLLDLLQSALGEQIQLRLVPGTTTGLVKGDPGQIERLLMHLALGARESHLTGAFVVETAARISQSDGERYVTITVTPPKGGDDMGSLPALDEIARQSAGEVRIESEGGRIQFYLPSAAPAGDPPSVLPTC
jgi:PAS domain S-box-containing protein